MTVIGTLKPGNVPTERIGPIIAALVRERWPYGGGLAVLAEKVGCDESAVESIIAQEWPGVTFDLADRLLCALGRWDMWHGVLADIYPTKFVETCALPSCNKTFPESKRRYVKRYCSPQCLQLARDVRAGHGSGLRMRAKGRCYRGHKFTPENTRIRRRSSGEEYKVCQECERGMTKKRQARWRAKHRDEINARQRARRKAGLLAA